MPARVIVSQDGSTVQITTIDHQWSATLEEKSLLGNAADVQQALHELPAFFEGAVSGKPASWIRLMRSSAKSFSTKLSDSQTVLTGSLYVDDTLYELDYREDMGGYALATLGKVNLATGPLSLNNSARSITESTLRRADTVAPKAIRIGIVVDSQYNEYYNRRGLAHALGVINGVDGLYQSQLGLALVVETYRVYDEPADDPLRDYQGTVEQILDHYRDIRLSDPEMPEDLALVHLFSGHIDPQKVIGLGWIDTVCRVDGYDLSMSTPFSYDVLLSAHEIAHNLGAVHDDDANCKTDPSVTGSEIMWSELSGDTQPQFSSCSLNRMRTSLNESCMADNIDVGLQLTATPTPTGQEHEILISVANFDESRSARQIRTSTRFPAGTQLTMPTAGCRIDGTTLNCLLGNVAASTIAAASVDAVFANAASPVITSELVLDEFMDTQPLDNRASVQVSASQVTSSGSIDPVIWHAETDLAQPAIPPANDAGRSGGSAGTGSTRLPELLVLGVLAWLVRRRRSAHNQAIGGRTSVAAFH